MPKTRTGEFVPVNLTALDVHLSVRPSGSHGEMLDAAVRHAWARCLLPGNHFDSEDLPGVDVVHDSSETVVAKAREAGALASTSLEWLMDALSPTITTHAIEQRAGDLLMLHACALADPASGVAVVLIGPSGAGKSTMAMSLGDRLGYLTDETVGVREDLSIVAYPKPLSLLRPALAPLKAQVSPSELGLREPPDDCRVGPVLLLERASQGPLEPVLERVPTVQALAEVAPETSYLATLTRPLHRLAAALDAGGGTWRVRYREAATLTPVVTRLLGGAS